MPDEAPAEDAGGATPPPPEAPQEEADPADLGDAGKQAISRMKAERNAARDEAKQLRDRLAELEQAQMTEQERAVAEAKAAGRAEALAEVSVKLVNSEFKAAAAGRLDDDNLTTLLEGINHATFLDDSGEVTVERVRALIDGIAPAPQQGAADLGQGARSTPPLGSDPLLQALKNTVGAR